MMATIRRRRALAAGAPLSLVPADGMAAPADATETAWREYLRARAAYTAGAGHDRIRDRLGELYCDAEAALQATRAVTLLDVERKLAAAHDFGDGLQAAAVEDLLATVRAIRERS